MFEKTDKRRIYWLIDQYLSNKIDSKIFSDEFYYCYDLEVDRNSLTELERKVFRNLSDVAARFSQYEEDHEKYPGVYYTEQELKEKVIETKKLLER